LLSHPRGELSVVLHRALAAIAQRQLGLITHSHARQLLSQEAIDGLVRTGRWERVHRGVYRIAGYPVTYEQRVLAACLAAGPHAVASHRSAAWIWGLLDEEPDVVEIAVPRSLDHRLRGVVVHRATDLLDEDITLRGAIPCTNPMRTLVDLAAVAPVGLTARALDRARHEGLVTLAGVRRALDRVARKGRRGVRALRRLLDERVDLPRPSGVFEARFAALVRRFALPVPRAEYDVHGDDHRWIGRVDFAYPEAKLFIELDGLETHGSGPALQRDLARQNALVDAGWQPLRYTWVDVTRRDSAVAAEVRRVRRRRLQLLGVQNRREHG
jgi:hypothetical protein